jgi:hypothetical protein
MAIIQSKLLPNPPNFLLVLGPHVRSHDEWVLTVCRGILICAGSMSGLAEEAPVAYKDVSRVVGNVGLSWREPRA